MNFAVLQFPGSNCDQDLVHVLKNVLGHSARLLWHKESSLGDSDAVFIPGGFSYGDYLRTGAIALRGGLSEDLALKALTLHGAQMLHLDDRCGSLEKGKDADFVVLSGAPFSVYTQVLQTYIEGEKVFDRDLHEDWAYQAGGFALARNKDRLPPRAASRSSCPPPRRRVPPRTRRLLSLMSERTRC